MSPQLFFSLLGLLGAAVVAGVFTWRFISYRGRRIVTCPETQQPAGVELDAWLAARRRGIEDEPALRLESCSRWPEHEDCCQACVAQIEASPEGTLMRNILVAWLRGKSCAFCGQMIDVVAWHDEMPALRSPDGSLREWEGIAAADLPAMLATDQAVCSNCLLTESFRRDNPSLVTDRAETALRNRLFH
ncbi:MAG TPA: hypothetical protein VNN08_05735 [Thermoanaerobaculia bacterium]|nr:hypothetical protein [Thermoanaerobaculia bacterium]